MFHRKNLSSEGFFLFGRGHGACVFNLRVGMVKVTHMKVYFFHPHSPWERGTCENTNGLLRQFFPKGRDLSRVSFKEIRRVERLMNGRPRKVLEGATPREAFSQAVALGV